MTDRGISVAVNYALTLAIATVLMSGLLFATGDLVENRQQEVYIEELRVVGERLAAKITAADQISQTNPGAVHINITTPTVVGGADYDIEINASSSQSELVLTTRQPEVEVTVSFVNSTDVEPTTIDGGRIHIYLASDGDLVVENL